MRAGGVEVEFLWQAGGREVETFGGGECRCDIGIGVWAGEITVRL